MSPFIIHRRQFLRQSGVSLGAAALAQLLSRDLLADETPERNSIGGLTGLPHFPAKAKRVIYLFQGGGPSQLDLFDYKPQLHGRQGSDLPDSICNGQRLTAMTATQATFPIAPQHFQVLATRAVRYLDERGVAVHIKDRR
jgi:hypothetical protein